MLSFRVLNTSRICWIKGCVQINFYQGKLFFGRHTYSIKDKCLKGQVTSKLLFMNEMKATYMKLKAIFSELESCGLIFLLLIREKGRVFVDRIPVYQYFSFKPFWYIFFITSKKQFCTLHWYMVNVWIFHLLLDFIKGQFYFFCCNHYVKQSILYNFRSIFSRYSTFSQCTNDELEKIFIGFPLYVCKYYFCSRCHVLLEIYINFIW